jgi:trehalose 2-sulfotransferase
MVQPVVVDTPPGREAAVSRSTYDLATQAADYPPRSDAPRRTVIVCSHMRSGSTLLGEAMYFAGGLGCPIEYFHRGFRPSLAQVWGAIDDADYLRELYRRRTDPTGTLGLKLFWMDVLDLCERRFPDQTDLLYRNLEADEEAARDVYALVETLFAELFPNPVYIWLTRKDRLRAAVSHWIAAQTQVFRRIPTVNDNVPVRAPEYDYDRIAALYGSVVYSEARWEGLFRSLNVAPVRLAYEDLVSSYEATVRRLLAEIGEAAPTHVPPPRMERQASAISERFMARFLREHEARAHARR